MNVAKGPTNRLGLLKGKAISTSTPSFSIRYNAEEEEVEQLYESPKIGEAHSDNSSPQTTPLTEKRNKESLLLSKANKRSGSFEEGSGEPWRLFSEIKGRITKTVEEKLEEIKSDRAKQSRRKLKTNSSLSDSEEKSEASSSIRDSSSPEKSLSEKLLKDLTADSDLGDVSDTSLSPDRATTPTVTEVDVSDTVASKEPHTIPHKRHIQFSPSIHTKEFRHKAPKFPSRKPKTTKYGRDKIELGVEAVETQESEKKTIFQAPSLQSNKETPVNMFYKRGTYFTVSFVMAIAGVAYMCRIPQFLIGFFLGASVCLIIIFWSDYVYNWITGGKVDLNYLHGAYVFENLPFLTEKMISLPKANPDELLFEGWMNEYCYEYQPELYHITQTETVYVRLEGNILRLATPRHKIPKRAVWNEQKYKLRFDKERAYDIANCVVKLLPDRLAHKRIWSKKYPICIVLQPQSHLGTRYREEGTSSLVSVSYTKSSPKKTIREKISVPFERKSSLIEEEEEENSKKDEESEGSHNQTPTLTPESDATPEICLLKIGRDNEDLISDLPAEVVEDDEEEDEITSGYVKVPSSLINKNNIYLFARTDREKEMWFRRLVAAVGFKVTVDDDEMDDQMKAIKEKIKTDQELRQTNEEHYYNFMSRLGQMKCTYEEGNENVMFDKTEVTDENLVWLNTFLGRILYDAMHDAYWVGLVQDKIQRKLSAIKVPTFMEEFIVSNLEFNDSIPVIENSNLPKLNQDGIWVELDFSYQGTFKMTVDTKINLIKMKNLGSKDPAILGNIEKSKSAIFDSSLEDSAESSCEEESLSSTSQGTCGRPNTSHKVLQMVDKIAASKYFQQVTDNKLVKKALEGVSNTTISLYVEVKSLIGTIILNFPPPPSDRLWYGFKPDTKLHLSAKPKVGEHGINMTYITSIIEKKLHREFQKILVVPNMDDLIIPLMSKEKPY